MDLYEPYNISFLDLSDVDDQEQRKILSSLYSDNSKVQLPWKTENKLAPMRDELQNGFAKLAPTHAYAQSQSHEEFGAPPNAAVYLTHVNYGMQPTFYMNASTAPNYQPPFPLNPVNPAVIVNNVNFVNNISCNQPVSAPTSDNVAFANYTNEVLATATNTVELDAGYYSPDPEPEYVSSPPAVTNHTIEATHVADVKISEPIAPQQNGTVQKNEAAADGKKTWASLFNAEKSAELTDETGADQTEKARNEAVNIQANEKLCPIKHPRRAQFVDPNCYRMGEFLLSHNVDGRTISLQPRGLINRSNYCYINSILQALLACPPMYNLMSGLAQQNTSSEKKKATPIIDGICRFVKEFQHLPAGMRVNRRNDKNQKKEQGSLIDCDLPFEPFWTYKMLNGVRSDSFLVEGRQEDAEEFLGCLLNGLNDEILELMKLVRNETTIDVDKKIMEQEVDKEWQVMGPKNKGAITRQTDIGKTPISDIFGGSLKSRIHRAGDQSTYNIQPFFTLQLNIEKVKTVREALEALVSRNKLEGVTSSKTNEEVEAWQQVMLEELPVILVLHLKCFDFKLDGCTKIVKALEFPIDLKIDSKLLSKPSSPKEKQYKLFAIVYHDGKEATKGHYITDAFHVGYSTWIRYDDASVKTVHEEQVLKPQGTRVPYLLFYRRSDTIRSK